MIRRTYSLLVALLITGSAAMAQDAMVTTTSSTPVITNKKGEAYLPVTDEWALGISANPFLGYLGNFLNGTINQGSPAFTYAGNPNNSGNLGNNLAIFGKKMVDEHTAYRVRFNVSVRNNNNKAVVAQNLVSPTPGYPSFAEDWQKVNTAAVVIAPGFEKRRGSTRLQGIYGGELVLGFSSSHIEYQYANALSSTFPTPLPGTTNFGGNISGASRVTDNKAGTNFLVGARGFIGVEYFFAPKISIGGEFGYMVSYQTQSKGKLTTETWDAGNNNVRTTKSDQFANGGTTSIGVGIDNLSGSINLLFYF